MKNVIASMFVTSLPTGILSLTNLLYFS